MQFLIDIYYYQESTKIVVCIYIYSKMSETCYISISKDLYTARTRLSHRSSRSQRWHLILWSYYSF